MDVAPWISVLKLVVLGGIALATLGGAAWALFRDRARGRRRCPDCWYDLTWTEHMQCSECGFEATRERQFGRTRRRWWWALGAIVVGTVAGDFFMDRTMHPRDALRFVPAATLIDLLPTFPQMDSAVANELKYRIGAATAAEPAMDDADWLRLLRVSAAGTDAHAPPNAAWQSSVFGWFVARAGRAALSSPDPDIRIEAGAIVADLAALEPPRIGTTIRSTWPADLPPTVTVWVEDWFDLPGAMRLTVTPAGAPEHRRTFLYEAMHERRPVFNLELPARVSEHPAHEDVTVSVERRIAASDPWRPAGSVRARVQRPRSVPQVLEPRRGPDVDAVVREAFAKGSFRRNDDGVQVQWAGWLAYYTFTEELNDTAFGARAEVRRNGATAAVIELWWLAGLGGDDRLTRWEPVAFDHDVIRPRKQPDDVWTVRVTGDPAIALRVPDGRFYWDGSIEMPLRVRHVDRPARAWGWIAEELRPDSKP